MERANDLGRSAAAGDMDAVRRLVAAGADVNQADNDGSLGDGWTPLAQPTAMDEDAMPKDRMAVLGDPEAPGLMYVAGNAGALAWRVNISSGVWTKMWDTPDVYGNFGFILGPFPTYLPAPHLPPRRVTSGILYCEPGVV